MFYNHWKKIFLSLTGFFWAGCGDTSSEAVCLYGPDPNYSNDSESIYSSADMASESSAEQAQAPSSATEPNQSSSSEGGVESSAESAPESSSAAPIGPYKLSWNTAINCKMDYFTTGKCLGYIGSGSGSTSTSTLRDMLVNNRTRTLEELDSLEEELENLSDCAPVYGVPTCYRYEILTHYVCDNDSSYLAGEYLSKDSLIYPFDEYMEKFPLSSNSAESSSSLAEESSSSEKLPTPLCQKTDFNYSNIDNILYEIRSNKLDSVRNATSDLSEEQKECLTSIYVPGSYGCNEKPIARKQVCDGDTIVNPRYQAKLDSTNANLDRQIKACMNEEDTSESSDNDN